MLLNLFMEIFHFLTYINVFIIEHCIRNSTYDHTDRRALRHPCVQASDRQLAQVPEGGSTEHVYEEVPKKFRSQVQHCPLVQH